MEIGLVRKIDIDSEMQQAYLDYAMSVIVARALPDARDGLKPVHRRILYAMYDMGLRAESSYKKSARIVGEVLGKYHPHGDMAVYDAMARMAQDFSMRCLLVDGQGNFGSVDGDPPAAMRYTEARLHPAALQLLADIGKETVDFSENFDGTLKEPTVLPGALPNLLVNGATGIAVGMATSIPPHNLTEVVDAILYMLANWKKLDDISLDQLMQFVQGPDFPTGGIILTETGDEGLHSAYGSGRGRVTLQAKAHPEEMDRGRNRIIVTELPYMVNKASLIERIAELARDGKLEGISDLRDESDRQGMRIVIELTKAADPEAVLHELYKHTPMQTTFSIIMLALVQGEPRLLSLKTALRVYVEHRLEIIRRRSEFDLARARARAHILEGLSIALKNLDEVIDTIRRSPDADTARERLMKKFKLSELQAVAILDMPLRRLAALERKKIEEEYKEVREMIKGLEELLASPEKMRSVVGDELRAVKAAYGDRRRTHIITLKPGERRQALVSSDETVAEEKVWITITPDGLISRNSTPALPGESKELMPAWLLQANSRDVLYLVTESGEAAALGVHTLPHAEEASNGAPLEKACALHGTPRLAGLFTAPAKDRPADRYILTVSRSGMLKKSALSDLPGPSAGTFTLARVNDGDQLCDLHVVSLDQEILLATTAGMAIRFSTEEIRPMGLVAGGVLGVKLGERDQVVGSALIPNPGEVFLLASDGSAKRVPVDGFPRQGRYGLGVQAWKLSAGVRLAKMVLGPGALTIGVRLEKAGYKVVRLDDAPLTSRAARGGSLVAIKPGDQVEWLVIPRSSIPGAQVGLSDKPARRSTPARPAAPDRKEAAKIPTTKSAEKPAAAKASAVKTMPKPAAPKAKAAKTAPKPAASKSGPAQTPPKPVAPKKGAPSLTPEPAAAKSSAVKTTTKPADVKSTAKLTAPKSSAVKTTTKPAAAKSSAVKTTTKPAASQAGIVKTTPKPAESKASKSKTTSKPATPKSGATKTTPKPTPTKTSATQTPTKPAAKKVISQAQLPLDIPPTKPKPKKP